VLREWAGVTKADIDMHRPILIATLVELFGEVEPEDRDAEEKAGASTLEVVWAAAKAVLGTIDKEDMPRYVTGLRKALQGAHDAARRNTEAGGPITVPGCASLQYHSTGKVSNTIPNCMG
jgi:hypothetical protein